MFTSPVLRYAHFTLVNLATIILYQDEMIYHFS